MNSIMLLSKINTIFRYSENSKTSDLHRLLINRSYKIKIKRSDKCIAFSKS